MPQRVRDCMIGTEGEGLCTLLGNLNGNRDATGCIFPSSLKKKNVLVLIRWPLAHDPL